MPTCQFDIAFGQECEYAVACKRIRDHCEDRSDGPIDHLSIIYRAFQRLQYDMESARSVDFNDFSQAVNCCLIERGYVNDDIPPEIPGS